jgi:hypothetical protein
MRSARFLIPGLFTIFLAFCGQAAAQEPARGRQSVAVPQPAAAGFEAPDAERTREQLRELLEKYPPALARVLKLDTSLLNNEAYLAPYPALNGFLAQHPEVRRSPAFFLEWVPISGGGNYYREDAQTQVYRMWNDVLAGTAGISVFVIVLLALGWAIRYIVDYRRWHRLSKVQSEVHNKLLDRMTANEELLAYVKSPAGSRFLESAPIALDPVGRKIAAPLSRILWSVQAGLVLAAGGFGLQYVANHVNPEVTQPIFAMGVLAIALGIGFVLSAVVSYVLSQRLGLFESPQAAAPITTPRVE